MLPIYQDRRVAEEARVRDLLGRMTLEEKFAQLRMNYDVLGAVCDETVNEKNFEERFEKVFDPTRMSCAYIRYDARPELLNLAQKYIIEHSRLGIPMLFMGESLHGAMVNGATVFPQAIGLGATFDPALVGEVAAAAARDSRAYGVRMTYAPDVDISQDPRWGRVEENYGEDPYLTSKLAVSYVQRLQREGVASCPKHYLAHGTPEGGLNISPVHVGEREIREQMLPPFAAVVKEGGCWGMMPAYSELDGTPLHASRYWLTDVLRDELGFDGFTTSDFGAVGMMHSTHRAAETPTDAGERALMAGIDVEAPGPTGFTPELEERFRSGKLPMEALDTAVARVLRIKFRLGLFDEPYVNESLREDMRSEKDLKLAYRAALESAVLLQNDNNVLPLKKGMKIVLVGPNADFAQLGDYTAPENLQNAVSLREGLASRLGVLAYEPGCGLVTRDAKASVRALDAASRADVIIAALGDTSHSFGGVGWGESDAAATCGEGYDTHSLTLPECQRELLANLAALHKPLVLVLYTGRPYALNLESEFADAIVQAWYPGEQGGNAIADLLLGRENFSGKLPISFPASVGQLPCYYNHKRSARGFYKKPGSPGAPGRDYLFADPAPLFRFGHGLSYSKFKYYDLRVEELELYHYGVAVTVRNDSEIVGTEVVQLYLTDEFCRITPYVERLRGFERVTLAPHEERVVHFDLKAPDFCFVNERMEQEIEGGAFTVRVEELKVTFEVH